MRCTLDEPTCLFLRHAARDAEDQLRLLFLEVLDLADLAVDMVLSRLAHATGVDENEVGLGHIIGLHIADARELTRHALGVAHVHLTAVDQQLA